MSRLGGKAGGTGVIDLPERDSIWPYPVSDVVEEFDVSMLSSAERWRRCQRCKKPWLWRA